MIWPLDPTYSWNKKQKYREIRKKKTTPVPERLNIVEDASPHHLAHTAPQQTRAVNHAPEQDGRGDVGKQAVQHELQA